MTKCVIALTTAVYVYLPASAGEIAEEKHAEENVITTLHVEQQQIEEAITILEVISLVVSSQTEIIDLSSQIESLNDLHKQLNTTNDINLTAKSILDTLDQLRTVPEKIRQSLNTIIDETAAAYAAEAALTQMDASLQIIDQAASELTTHAESRLEIITKNDDIRKKILSVDLQLSDSLDSLEAKAELLTTQTSIQSKNIAELLASLIYNYGSYNQSYLQQYLAENGYTVLKNGEFVYYGELFSLDTLNKNLDEYFNDPAAKNLEGNDDYIILTRKKLTKVYLIGSADDSSSVNAGTKINAVTQTANGDYRMFFNNGRILTISEQESRKLISGYFWVAYDNGHLVINQNFSNIYFISQHYINQIRENEAFEIRLLGLGKLVASAVSGAFALGGAILLDTTSAPRDYLLGNYQTGFPLTERNTQIASEWLHNSWQQFAHNKFIDDLPLAIVPAVLNIEQKSKVSASKINSD